MSNPESPENVLHPRGFPTRMAAFHGGVHDVLRSAAPVLGASYIGLGSLLRELGLGLDIGIVSTLTTWALPGQVASFELYAIGAPLLSVFIAVSLINFRFLPMVVTLLPLVRDAVGSTRRLYAVAHFIAVSAWVLVMLRGPDMPPQQRLPYFAGCTIVLMPMALLGTAIGYLAAGAVPPEVSYGLVFINPIFFMLVLLVDLRQRARILALVLGAATGPALHLLTPTWGLLISGLVAGTAAFLLDRRWTAKDPGRG